MKKILIIEDNYDLAQNTRLFLKEYGYDVILCPNGKEGLKVMLNYQPDLILCDVMLPDINGYKILSEIKKLDNPIPPIVIFITAKTQRDDIRKGMSLGADDYITKPFTFDELLRAIDVQFKKRNKLMQIIEKEASSKFLIKENVQKNNLENTHKSLAYNGHIYIDIKKNPCFYPVKDLLMIRSMKDYTLLIFTDGKKYIIRKLMKYWEKYLPNKEFIRIHRQTIINLNYIEKIERLSSNRFSISLKYYQNRVGVSQRYGKRIKKILT
jgi:DNA-binding LytR/AlgR family response regulator